MSVELGSAYISINARTDSLAKDIEAGLKGTSRTVDRVGTDMGQRLAKNASKAMKDGWKPGDDIMAGIPNTKLDRIGARIGQVIGKGVGTGLRAHQAGVEFGRSFGQGAGSIGLGSIFRSWSADAKDAGSKVGFLAGKALSTGIQAAMVGGVGAIAYTLTKGLDRLKALDTAKYKLEALGKSSDEVKDIVKTVTDAVTGTPFALDAAFSTATQAIGANVKDLKRFMTDVSDAAGFAGVDIDRMGLIFNQVLAKGKLTGEEMMQLMEAGLPAKSWIMDSFKLTSDQFDKMQAKGEVTMEMLETSIEKHAGGMAKKLGDTLQGSIDNMQTSISRLGANFLGALFGGESGDPTESMKDAVQRVTGYLEQMNAWVVAHKEDIHQFFLSAKDAASDLAKIVGDILGLLKNMHVSVGDVVLAFAAWKTIEGVASLAKALKGIGDALDILPGKASKSVSGINTALAGIAIPAALVWLMNQQTPDGKNNLLNGKSPEDSSFWDKVESWMTKGFSTGPSEGPFKDGDLGGDPGGQRQRRGVGPTNALDPGFFLPNSGAAPSSFGSTDGSSPVPAGLTGNQAVVYSAMIKAGFPASEWGAMKNLMMGESGFRNDAQNPTSTAYGLFQFLDSTWATVGGTKTSDPGLQSQYGLQYIKQRYGSPSKAWAFWQAQSPHWYADGGKVWGGTPGKDSIAAWLMPGEHVLTKKDVDAMGGQSAVYDFRDQLHATPLAEIQGSGQRGKGKWKPGGQLGGSAASGGGWQTGIHGRPGGSDVEIYIPGGTALNPDKRGSRRMMPSEAGGWFTLPAFAKGGSVLDDMRTAGAIPSGAQNTQKAGESGLANLIDIPGEVINGLIDQAASAASTAAGLAISAGTFGAGAAGGSQAGSALASMAIGLGANAAKRGVTWAFDEAGIGVDAIGQILNPFGGGKGVDWGSFVPTGMIQGALSDLMSQGADQAINDYFGPKSVDPNTTQHGTGKGAPPGPNVDPTTGQPVDGFGFPNQSNQSLLSTAPNVDDLPAAHGGIDMSVKVENAYAQDPTALANQIAKQQQLNAMQHTGRPY